MEGRERMPVPPSLYFTKDHVQVLVIGVEPAHAVSKAIPVAVIAAPGPGTAMFECCYHLSVAIEAPG